MLLINLNIALTPVIEHFLTTLSATICYLYQAAALRLKWDNVGKLGQSYNFYCDS